MSNTKDDAVAEIINLRRVKRRLVRDQAAQAAQEKRVRHGRSKIAADADRRQLLLDKERVDGTRLEDDDGASGPK